MTSLQDLGVAYHKGKVNLYYSSQASLDAIVDYEDALHANLTALLAKLQSAALDMRAYIIQCNDRQYGDSRIRARAKHSWERDVLRVKGGGTDYCLIGEIDVEALLESQSSHRFPAKPFKPVPDGFEIDFGRKLLPAGEKE